MSRAAWGPPDMGPPKKAAGPYPGPATHITQCASEYNRTDGHRRVNGAAAPLAAGWRRKAWLDCGCFDPCRCDYRNTPTQKRIDAYADAVAWLEGHGLPPAPLMPECRGLWARGGNDRATASRVVRRWAA